MLFYEPHKRDRVVLPHDPFKALIAPRPIGWVTTRSKEGAINLAAPNPLTNAEFMRGLREAAGVRFGLPASGWVLELGTFFLRTESELVLKSRRVAPGRLLNAGFKFRFPEWREAAHDLVCRWKQSASGYAASL